MTPPARTPKQRKRDALNRLEHDTDAWVATEIPDEVGDAFAAKTGFDPRQLTSPYRYFRIRPQRLQAWREVNELKGRELMRGGHWVVPA
jgi:hypothetical protein